MKKFPKIRYPSDSETDGVLAGEVVVTEKVDGANFRFTWDEDGALIVGSRNHSYPADDENVPKAFRHAIDYIQATVPEEWKSAVSDYTFFGEAMHVHSLDYDDIDWHIPSKGSAHVPLDSEYPNVVIFDVYDNEADEWVSWDKVIEMSQSINMQWTRVLDRGHGDDVSLDVPAESMFGGPPEGIVVRRTDGSLRAKKVTDDFKEKNAQSFNDPSKAQSDAAEFVAMFVTDNRIEKQAHKLIDEGEYDEIRMEMMEQLPVAVLQDVMNEEGWNLLADEYTFECEFDSDFKGEVRSKASSRCARVLRSLCQQF
jgi:hypothetical protein